MRHTTHVKQYFHWLLILAPLVAIPLAIVLGAEERYVELAFILVALLANVIIILVTLSFDKGSDQSLVRTFLTDDLRPNKLGGPLEFQAELVVIEDESAQGSQVLNIKEHFSTATALESGQDLVLIPFACRADESDARRLAGKLKDAHAILVIRSEALESKEWVYKTIDAFAFQRSDVPILFTELEPTLRKSTIPDKYFSVPNDPQTLPWRLMQRANERGFEWRRVASFNRLMATNALILLIVSFCLGYYLIESQRNDEYTALRAIFSGMATQTRRDYQAQSSEPSNGDFSVSYWFRYKGEIRQLISTENKVKYMSFKDSPGSDIGCAFTQGNAITQWLANDPGRIQIWNDKDQTVENPSCSYMEENAQPPNQLICSSFNNTTPLEPQVTVGICVVTRGDKNLVGSDDKYRKFLRARAEEFFNSAYRIIRDKQLIPFTE